MKLLHAIWALFGATSFWNDCFYLRPLSLHKTRRQHGHSSTPVPPTNGVDGWVYDQYPDFVPLPQETQPRKGELPPQYLVSPVSPFVANCEGVGQAGTSYPNAEVEPSVAVNPANPDNLVGAWQQDRWSNGAARGLSTGISFDGANLDAALSFSRAAVAIQQTVAN